MASFEVVLRDLAIEVVDGADAFRQEGPMTTFFTLGEGRDVVDAWADRVASIRTADIRIVRRIDATTLRAVG